jgi:hypothetical protein
LVNRKGRAQSLVPPDNLADRVLQRVYVQQPAETERERQIINRGIRLKLFKKPETLLGK